jgi:hypothetical protein
VQELCDFVPNDGNVSDVVVVTTMAAYTRYGRRIEDRGARKAYKGQSFLLSCTRNHASLESFSVPECRIRAVSWNNHQHNHSNESAYTEVHGFCILVYMCSSVDTPEARLSRLCACGDEY